MSKKSKLVEEEVIYESGAKVKIIRLDGAYKEVYDDISDTIYSISASMLVKVAEDIHKNHPLDRSSLVAVMRDGWPVSIGLQYYFKSKYNKKVPVEKIAISAYSAQDSTLTMDMKTLEDIVYRNFEKRLFFVDGWTMEGRTKQYIDGAVSSLEESLYIDIEHRFCALIDMAVIADIKGTIDDVLVPWAMCEEDHIGLSHIFRNEKTGKYQYLPIKNNYYKQFKKKWLNTIDNVSK